jgi:hypothetical protein
LIVVTVAGSVSATASACRPRPRFTVSPGQAGEREVGGAEPLQADRRQDGVLGRRVGRVVDQQHVRDRCRRASPRLAARPPSPALPSVTVFVAPAALVTVTGALVVWTATVFAPAPGAMAVGPLRRAP